MEELMEDQKALNNKIKLLEEGPYSDYNKKKLLEFVAYCRRARNNKPYTIFKTLISLKQCLDYGWIDKGFNRVTKEDVQYVIDKMMDKNWTTQTQKSFKCTLKIFWRFLKNVDEVGQYPKEVSWIKTTMKREIMLRPEHIWNIESFGKMCTLGNTFEKALLWTAWSTAARPSEFINLKKSSLRFTKYGVDIFLFGRLDKPQRFIPCIECAEPLRAWLREHPLRDEEIRKIVEKVNPNLIKIVEKHAKKIERLHGHDRFTIIASERYKVVNEIAKDCMSLGLSRVEFSDKLHEITTHSIWGYIIMALFVASLFYVIFKFGNFFSDILINSLMSLNPVFEQSFGTGVVSNLAWGLIEGLIAGITIVLPYILPFYVILGLLEDSGYLFRIAFLMDRFMHKIGLHGKAFIPLMLGYGCNVPACLGCRIMETKRERLIAVFVTTLIPCAAVTTVIFGLVGKYVGLSWALLLYVVDLMIIFVLGRIAFKVLPGEPTELIMKMNPYKTPHLKTVTKQAWFRIKDFIYIAFPLIIACSFIIKILDVTNLSESIENLMKPITVGWLGLPTFSGIALITGIPRKELTLITLATHGGTTNFAAILTPVQMIVFSLVTMLYIPCIATIAALVKEIGWKKAIFITVFRIVFAIFVGGVAFRMLTL